MPKMPVKINPRRLRGPWIEGYALDLHTISSTLIGHNQFGHPVFDTKRSPLGDLLYRLKNAGDLAAIEPIVETVEGFLGTWKPHVEMLVPVPPSNRARRHQPVMAIAKALCEKTGMPLCETSLSKVKSTAQLKDVFDFTRRAQILQNAFTVDEAKTRGKRILLFDDLYRSGATVSTITRLLTGAGAASAVYLLTLTQTRKLA